MRRPRGWKPGFKLSSNEVPAMTPVTGQNRRAVPPRKISPAERNHTIEAARVPDDMDRAALLGVLQRAGEDLGLSKRALAQSVGEAPSFFDPRQKTSPVAPRTYQRIGLMLRLHDSLSSLVGHDAEHMRGWMGALNRPTGGIPAKQLSDLEQLGKLVRYLEAFNF